MRTYLRMKKGFSLCCTLALLAAMLGLPLSVQAQDNHLTIPLYHKHIAECEGTVYKIISADGTRRSSTTHKGTCACGSNVDYYSFYGTCSCGNTWYTTGHACDNSQYGPKHGNCSNYSILNTNTSHSHPFQEYVCGQTEETVIETVVVEKDCYLPAASVSLTAYAQGCLEGIVLSWGNGIQGHTITVEENGSYPLYITYSENGIEYMTEASVEVDNIDKEPPSIEEIKISESEFTSEDICLTVEVGDSYGLPEECIRWNGGTFTSEREFVVTDNGIYEVVVQDYAGNQIVQTIEIANIDKTAPQLKGITTQPTPWYEGSCIVKIEAEDLGNGNAGSGLCEDAYSWDGGVTWSANNTFTLEEPGNITVLIKDKVGNIKEETFEVKRQIRQSNAGGNITQDESSEDKETEEETSEDGVDENREFFREILTNDLAEEKASEEIKEETNARVEVVTKEPEEFKTAEEIVIPQTVTEDTSKRTNRTVVLWTICISLGTGLCGVTGMILFVLFGLCRVFETDENGKDKFLGSVGVRLHQKGYITVISSSLAHKAKSRNLKIKIPAWFVKNARYKLLRIKVGNQTIDKYVEKEVCFHIHM